jgi:tetratricopeptide (TPR) repeat protein
LLRRCMSLASMPATVMALVLLLGVDIREYLDSLRISHVLPISQSPNFFQAYRLISVAHLWDLLNHGMLVAPAAIMGLFLLRRRANPMSPETIFLICAFAFPALFAFLFNPEIGAFRDWDLLSLPALPLTLLVALTLARQIKQREALAHVCLLIVGSAALHTVIWIGINADATAAESRFIQLLENGSLSDHARAYGWETIGSYFTSVRSDANRALGAFEKAIAVDDDNPRYWNLAGVILYQQGRNNEAINYLQRAIALQPDKWPENYNNLAAVYSAVGRHVDAVRCLRRAVELNPEYTDGFHNLGMELARLSRFEESVVAFKRAVKLQPTFWEARCDLARALLELERKDEAVDILEEVVSQEPSYMDAYDLLGTIYFRAGHPDLAIEIWQQAIQINPLAVDIYTNLAGAYNAIGRHDLEQRCLRKVLELNPEHPQAAVIRHMLQPPHR